MKDTTGFCDFLPTSGPSAILIVYPYSQVSIFERSSGILDLRSLTMADPGISLALFFRSVAIDITDIKVDGLGERLQSAVSGAEVVDGDPEALVPVVINRLAKEGVVGDGLLFGDLENDTFNAVKGIGADRPAQRLIDEDLALVKADDGLEMGGETVLDEIQVRELLQGLSGKGHFRTGTH